MSMLESGPGWTLSSTSFKLDPDLDRGSLGQHSAIRRRIDRIWAQIVQVQALQSHYHHHHHHHHHDQQQQHLHQRLTPTEFLGLHAQLCRILFQTPVDPAQARRLGLHDLLSCTGRVDRDITRAEFVRFLTSVSTSWAATSSLDACVAVLDRIENGLRAVASTDSIDEGTTAQIDIVRQCQSLAEAGLYARTRARAIAGEQSRRGSLTESATPAQISAPTPTAPSPSGSGWNRLRAWFKTKIQAVPRRLRWSSTAISSSSTVTDDTQEQATPSPSPYPPSSASPPKRSDIALLVDAQSLSDTEQQQQHTKRPRAQSMPELIQHRIPMLKPRSASVVIDSGLEPDIVQQAEHRLNLIVAGRKRIEALIGRMQSSDGDSDDRDLNPNFNDNADELDSDSDLSSSWSMDQRRERHLRLLHRMKVRSERQVQWPRDNNNIHIRRSVWSDSD